MRCKYEGDLQGTPCFISLTTCKRRFMFVIGRMLAPLGNNRKQEYSNLEASRAVKLSDVFTKIKYSIAILRIISDKEGSL
jgi:hypothetical protein